MIPDGSNPEYVEISDCSCFSLPAKSTLDLWQGTLDVGSSLRESFISTFSEEEKDRVMRFIPGHPRNRFVASRGILRRILSLYRGVDPRELRFLYGPCGKPELSERYGQPAQLPHGVRAGIHFNLSHSGERFILAVSLLAPVGADIEEMSATIDFIRIAERFFCPHEYQVLRHLPADQQKEAFYRCWTLKEAYAKARGEAMWDHMGRIEIPFLEEHISLGDPGEEGKESFCRLYGIYLDSHHRAAVAIRGNPAGFRYFRYGLR